MGSVSEGSMCIEREVSVSDLWLSAFSSVMDPQTGGITVCAHRTPVYTSFWVFPSMASLRTMGYFPSISNPRAAAMMAERYRERSSGSQGWGGRVASWRRLKDRTKEKDSETS